LSTGKSFYTRHQKVGKFSIKDVFGERSCEWQAREDTGILHQNDTRVTGSFGMEGMVWYVFRSFIMNL